MAAVDFYEMRRAGQTEPVIMVSYDLIHGSSAFPGAGEVSVRVLEGHAGSRSLRNYSGDLFSDPAMIAGLSCRWLLFDDAPREPGGSITLEYRDVFSVNGAQCEVMAKTIRRLNAKLAKQETQLGSPDTIGESVRRLAVAVGARFVVFHNGMRDAGFGYDDNRANYDWEKPSAAKDRTNRLCRAHYQKQDNASELASR